MAGTFQPRTWATVLLGVCLLPSGANAQASNSAKSTNQAPGPIDIGTAILSKSGEIIRIVFSQNLSPDGPQFKLGGVQLEGNPPEIAISTSASVSLEPSVILITLSGPLSSVSGVKVCFPKINWFDTNGKPQISDQRLCTPQVTQNYTDAKAAALKDLTGVPKSSTEKNVFASGFIATGSGTSQGGGNISLNPDLGVRGMTAFVNIDKATVAKGDPKMFNGGVGYRSVLPWGRGEVIEMANATTEQGLASALSKQQQRVFAGAVFDLQAKLEGDPGTFKVTNFVGETDLSLRSRTKRLGASNGYWRGFLMPGGFEVGQNLSAGDIVQPASSTSSTTASTTTVSSVDHVARYLAGLNLSTFYENWDGPLPLKRIELEMNALGRYLFLKEAMYNSSTKLFNTVGDGVRGYGAVDLKLYVGQSDSARYGIKLTYAVGSLPPTFARVKTFQLGLLFETKDDNTKAK